MGVGEPHLRGLERADDPLALRGRFVELAEPHRRVYAHDGRPVPGVDDDHLRLTWRVNRLKSRHAHREYPWSRTRRVISNVRVLEQREGEVDVTATIVCHRFRHRQDDHFVGRLVYTLADEGGTLRIRHRRVEIDQETLAPNGALSMFF